MSTLVYWAYLAKTWRHLLDTIYQEQIDSYLAHLPGSDITPGEMIEQENEKTIIILGLHPFKRMFRAVIKNTDFLRSGRPQLNPPQKKMGQNFALSKLKSTPSENVPEILLWRDHNFKNGQCLGGTGKILRKNYLPQLCH